MKVLLLLALATLGQCALLGSRKCTYGPSYWCSHIRHARECGAMQHCMTTVWKNQKVDMTGSTETCFSAIQVLDTVRRSHDDKIMTQMAIGCTGMPVEKRAVCKELMMHDQSDVYVLLKSDLSSKQVAAALGLCGGFPDTVPHFEITEQVSGDLCTDCVNFMGDLREIFNNSEGVIVAMFKKKVCSKMASFESLCDQLADQYFPLIFSEVFKETDPHRLCFMLQMCANQTHAGLMKDIKDLLAKHLVGGVECDTCKELMGDVQKFISDSAVQAKVIAFVEDEICSRLPGNYSATCKSYVTQYAPLVFSLLAAELDPQAICQDLHLCTSQKTHAFLSKPKMSSLECDVCKNLATDVQSLLRDATVQKDIMGFLENTVCSYLPGSLSDTCKTDVAQYGPLVFQVLLAELDPNTLCVQLGICSGPKVEKSYPIGLVHLLPESKNEKVTGEKCVLCEMVMGKLEDMIGGHATEAEIEAALDKVCSLLPGTIAGECASFVEEYTPMIVKLLLQEVSPKKICTVLGLCSSATVQPVKTVAPVNGGVKCAICEKIMKVVESELTEKTTEDEIEHILVKVCTILPADDQKECGALITTYFPAIMNMLIQEIDPKKICTAVDLCSAMKKTPSKSHPLKFQPMVDLQPAKPVLLGTNKCLYGPSYWCASVQNAKQCGTLEHCIKNGMKMDD